MFHLKAVREGEVIVDEMPQAVGAATVALPRASEVGVDAVVAGNLFTCSDVPASNTVPNMPMVLVYVLKSQLWFVYWSGPS
jgi:hypothetical protein